MDWLGGPHNWRGDSGLPEQPCKCNLRLCNSTPLGNLRHAVHNNKLANILLRPFFLVPVMFVEFGFFFLIAVRQGRRDRRTVTESSFDRRVAAERR